MGKSFRKPIIKDRASGKKDYWKTVRKSAKQKIRTFNSEEVLEIPNPKTIVNDDNYSEYRFIIDEGDKYYKKVKRK